MPDSTDAGLDALALYLATLGNENRLRLLRQLRRPRRLSELRVSPEASRRGENPERAVSRQAVRHHMEKLLAIDVAQRHKRGPAFAGDEFLVNHRQLFLIAEQVRDLARLEPTEAPAQLETRASIPLARPSPTSARALVLVHGVGEGRSWPLALGQAVVVGRAKDSQVRLDYDPFVSGRHVEVRTGPDGTVAMDLGSRNGTLLNWSPMRPRQPVDLRAGDVLGVGRSSLVVRL